MNPPEPNPMGRDDLRQELLDYLFGCHADPEALEARLARDPSLQRLLEETRPLASLLTRRRAAMRRRRRGEREPRPGTGWQRVEDSSELEARGLGRGRGRIRRARRHSRGVLGDASA
jgi:hypothetical protein